LINFITFTQKLNGFVIADQELKLVFANKADVEREEEMKKQG
jgi:hypothetical protein